MQAPRDIRYETCRDLYQRERARREQIRGSVATPVAALAFSVFNLSSLATTYDVARWAEPAGVTILVLALASVAAMATAAAYIVRVEWLFLYPGPPDLRELVAAEQALRAEFQSDPDTAEHRVSEQLTDLLTASYDIAYQHYLAGNEYSARSRTRGLRLVMLALLCLSVAFLLLPVHLADGAAG